MWTIVNLVLSFSAVIIALYATVLSRTQGDYGVILTPFATFIAAKQQPELYREMLMNVFLFLPIGLTLSNALPQKWHLWLRIGFTTFIGCVISAGIECAQYNYALGIAEVDDVICNTLGTFIGSTSLLIACVAKAVREKIRTRTLR